MYKIVEKEKLNDTVELMSIEAPFVATRAEAGQFVIIRSDKDAERIPLTIEDFDRKKGVVTIVYQLVGEGTFLLSKKKKGDFIEDILGPLGKPVETEGLKEVCIVGGGVGCAISYPVAKKFHQLGAKVHSVVGFRNKDLVILEKEFKAVSDDFILMTDDGSAGIKGLVTQGVEKVITENKIDRVVVIGPVIMMKFVAQTTAKYGVSTYASMNPIMIDGTGMCGCCRVEVDGQMKFACVDGPDFDAHKINFDSAMMRGRMYGEIEKHKHEETCNLFKKEVK